MKRHLHCAEQQVSRSNLTKYCACHAERLTYLVLIAYETSFTVRGATGVTIQPHQILHLPRKMTRLLYRPHIWNVISNARSNRCHYPTSPNTAPATKNDTARCQRKSPKTGETSFPMRGRLDHDPTMIRAWSEHDPTIIRPWNRQSATRLASEVTFRAHHEHFLLKNTTFRAQSYTQTFTKYCACHEKCHLNFTKYCACHEKWHLNFTKYCACHEKWHLNVTKYCACHEKCHLNVTKYCACHEKWHLNVTKYCACHEKWHLNFTKYCACHEKWHLNFTKYCACHEKWHLNFTKYCACHEKWRLNVTKYCACHEKCHLNVTKYCACHEKWHLNVTKYCACHEKWHLNFTKYCACHEKWHLNFTKYCACHEKWHLNFTKYCTCHEKWLDCCIVLTYETSFTVRGATGVTIQPHQMLRLSRRKTHMLNPHHISNLIYNARSNRRHPPTSPNAAPATKNDTAKFQRKSPKTGETSFPMRGRSDHDPRMIRAWSENDPSMKTQTATRLATEVTFRPHHEHFLL